MLSCLMRPQDKRHDALTHLCPFFCDLLGLYRRGADACPHRLSRLTGFRLSCSSPSGLHRRNIVSLYSLSLLTLFAACYYRLFLPLKLRVCRSRGCLLITLAVGNAERVSHGHDAALYAADCLVENAGDLVPKA